jgi:hypothetical protein
MIIVPYKNNNNNNINNNNITNPNNIIETNNTLNIANINNNCNNNINLQNVSKKTYNCNILDIHNQEFTEESEEEMFKEQCKLRSQATTKKADLRIEFEEDEKSGIVRKIETR